MNHPFLYQKAIALLKKLIQTPSFSGEENETARLIEEWLTDWKIDWKRENNNIWAHNRYFDSSKPSILLNSHHDTVKPNKGYTYNPFEAVEEEGKLYGLGSNDAGGCLVSLMALFVYFYEKSDLNYNLILATTAEEESSGIKGLKSLIKLLPAIDFAVVGEPTQMQLAIAEKGLLVIEGCATGISGHAAHTNTVNALYNAIDDINWIRMYEFPKISDVLGKVKMSVTQLKAGDQHNVVPATCNFVIDVRVNECYTNKEVFEIIDKNTKSNLIPRSLHLNASSIPINHPFVQAGLKLGRTTYGSPTSSDQVHLTCPSVKLGPGDSTRSHSADEYIFLKEIEEGIDLYINLFNEIL